MSDTWSNVYSYWIFSVKLVVKTWHFCVWPFSAIVVNWVGGPGHVEMWCHLNLTSFSNVPFYNFEESYSTCTGKHNYRKRVQLKHSLHTERGLLLPKLLSAWLLAISLRWNELHFLYKYSSKENIFLICLIVN